MDPGRCECIQEGLKASIYPDYVHRGIAGKLQEAAVGRVSPDHPPGFRLSTVTEGEAFESSTGRIDLWSRLCT